MLDGQRGGNQVDYFAIVKWEKKINGRLIILAFYSREKLDNFKGTFGNLHWAQWILHSGVERRKMFSNRGMEKVTEITKADAKHQRLVVAKRGIPFPSRNGNEVPFSSFLGLPDVP